MTDSCGFINFGIVFALCFAAITYNYLFMDDSIDKTLDDNNPIVGFQKIEIDVTSFTQDPNFDSLPILPTRNLVLFPGMTISFELARESSLALAKLANEAKIPIGIVCQINPDNDKPTITGGLYKYGVIADVLSVVDGPMGTHMAIVRSREKFRILGRGIGEWPCLYARVKPVIDVVNNVDAMEIDTLKEELMKFVEKISPSVPKHIMQVVRDIADFEELVNYCCTNLPIDQSRKIEMLQRSKINERALLLFTEMNDIHAKVKIKQEIDKRTRHTIDENQRNAFLQQQMETIRETLYGDDDEADKLISKAEASGMPSEVFTHFNKEIEKLRRYNPASPDYSVLYSYLDTLASLPWVKESPIQKDFSAAVDVLERDHYGLEKVKERIVEQLALLMHNPKGKAPIICLVGPPGVGKTSIGRSVATALGREYERVSFGGLHDEAEIRGHRRTYIGAMPGRIIDAMKRAGTVNPVLILDELDKIGADYKGDPAAALLEVLDPEQNCHFHDNYIDVDYDLSKVLFIATANTLSTIARPLLDRMEIINIPGYLVEEKIQIARKHLLPRIFKEYMLDDLKLNITDEALTDIIRLYTSESGVRNLEKQLAKIARKANLSVMKTGSYKEVVEPGDLYDLLGLAPFHPDRYEGNDFAGEVTGLAWTEVGGEILTVESSLSPTKTPSLVLTGKLGDVMKESATVAYQWVQCNAKKLGINPDLFDKYKLHIHFPEGAVPKDGPSAGITIATSIVSTFRQCRVAPRIAMTGEITLRGKVLPVGGIREKILAAKRSGIDTIILSSDNRRDIEDIPAAFSDGMTFHYVDTVDQVINLAVTDIPVANPIEL